MGGAQRLLPVLGGTYKPDAPKPAKRIKDTRGYKLNTEPRKNVLSDESVLEMRRLREQEMWSPEQIMKKFGTSPSVTYNVLNYYTRVRLHKAKR